MSLESWYRFDEDAASIGTDSLGSHDMTNTGVTSVSDDYGNAAYFDGSSYLNLASGTLPSAITGGNSRTFSCWIKGSFEGAIHANGADDDHKRYRTYYSASGIINLDFNTSTNAGSVSTTADTWVHYASTYEASTSLSKIYINGVEDVSRTNTNVNTSSGAFSIGRDPTKSSIAKYSGVLSDFRIYSGVVDAATINTLHSQGPLSAFLTSIETTMYTHLADLTWNTTIGASSYTVSRTEDAGTEETIASGITDLSLTTTDLNPGSSYVFNLYTDLDLVTPAATVTESAPTVSTVSVGDLVTRLGNDLTQISDTAFDAVDAEFRDVFSTGDVVILSTGDSVFVQDADTIEVVSGKDILTPFDPAAGSGQTCTITTQAGDSKVFTYDETSNELVVDSTNVSVGGSFLVGSYKITVAEV